MSDIELVYIPSLLVQSPLPVRDPKRIEFVRRSGNQEIKLISSPGVPFGHTGRMTLALSVTDAIRNHSPKVELGTVASWLSRLETASSGGERGSIGRVKDQFNRIAKTQITMTMLKKTEHGTIEKSKFLQIGEDLELFWDSRVSLSEMPTLFENYLLFDPRFYDYLVNHAVPVDLAVYDKFQKPLFQDIYAWLVWKLNSLEAPLPLRWEMVEAQFSDKPQRNPREWRKRWLLTAVDVITEGYKGAKVEGTDTGILLHPSPRAIKQRESGFVF